MRRQDEIRLLFPEQTLPNKKFLLSELDRFAQAFDADEVLELLRGQLGQAEAPLSHQALVTTTLFLPPYVKRRHGVLGEEQGVWSQYLGPGAEGSVAAVAKTAEATRRLRSAALERLTPLLESLAARMDGLPERVRLVVHLALALLPGGDLLLAKQIERKPSVETVWAWAAGGGAARDPERLVSHLGRQGPGEPDLLLAALSLPPAQIVDLTQRVAGRLDWMGTAHLAMAAGYAGGSRALGVLADLAQSRTGWGDVYVLRALEALGIPTGLDLVRAIAGRTQQDFVKQQAVRTAGSFASERALEFCLEQLGSTESSVTAQALESLVRLRCPRPQLAAAARPFLGSHDLRVRVNALLASVDPVEGRFPLGFGNLVRADEALPRIEGAFCLGYWQSQSALEILQHLAASDPHPQVRTQAIKSLSKYDITKSVPILTRLVETAPPAGAALAARVMSRLAGKAVAGVTEFFTRELVQHTDPPRRALLLTAPDPGSKDLAGSPALLQEPAAGRAGRAVAPGLRASRGATSAGDISRPVTLGELSADLRAKKSGRVAAKSDVGHALLAANYLVAGKTQVRELEAESISGRLLRNARRAAVFLRQNPVLLVPPAVLVLIAVLVLVSMLAPAPALEVRAQVALTVLASDGAAMLESERKPLGTADVVRVGEVLVMEKAGRLKLTTASGGRVVLLGPARVEVKARPEGGVLLAPVEGILEVDAPTEFIHVALARTGIESEGGSFVARVERDGATVEPRTGGVRSVDRAGTRTDLPAGKAHAIR